MRWDERRVRRYEGEKVGRWEGERIRSSELIADSSWKNRLES
jgi:hypothetical protein